ncbi:glycoside hydrolase family 3 N-terminal domain-containing protein [Butyrivibrio sp. INlla16]|uniref:glycoside hydrolase family 3 N-terminal domain-containing protein n=1 Tax=Butyrivibrio sp. INlla16 TaxID=1520807 RepID=UPI00087F6A49|nr:glycoside hydrolase family 3 N-terminal domain-containing protein [Butyrivibrio sp. INlla16]SDB23970.1 beta-glucosidase [Butyrivibrio sp. INlla16]
MGIALTKEQTNRVEELLSKMTLTEKIGQMNQESVSIVGGFDVPFEQLIEMMTDGRLSKEEFETIMKTAKTDYHEDAIREGKVGSLMVQDPEKCNELQKIAVEETRLGIPLIFGLDVIHGFRSVYPIAIAEAGSFDTELMEKTAAMAAKESRCAGVAWHFAPMLDVARDARWGRVSEGPGEDPYLGSCFARAKVRGLQNDHSENENYVAACLKHFVGYGAAEAGKDYNTVSMANHILYNNYLVPFRAAVEEGAQTAMASFNDLNGVPSTVNKWTLRDILKDNMGLPGFVVSDANAIKECVVHGIAEDEKDAGEKSANAGLDMDMGTEIYIQNLEKSVEEGKVSMEAIDDACRRVLSVKMWLGLFDHPYVSEEVMKRYEEIPKEHKELALASAEKSAVLLKNEGGLLPLKKDTKISLVGSLADNRSEVVGAWAISWKEKDCVSILDGMKQEFSNVNYYPCGGPEGDINDDEVKAACDNGDVIVAVLGETVAMSGEASSRADITLPGKQRELLQKLIASGKPVVLVLMNGRPLALQWEAENVPAILEGWHLGIQMGNAIAHILSGKKNPEGRLSSSFPAVTGQCPIYYNHPNTGRPAGNFKFTSRYLDAPFTALYPFGYGLSYTSFEYSDLAVTEDNDALKISVKVKNTGDREGTETVQFYMQDVAASIVRPVKELKCFEKVELNPGEEKTVEVKLLKKHMGFWNNHGKYCLEDGLFRIYAGADSATELCEKIRVGFEGVEKEPDYPTE